MKGLIEPLISALTSWAILRFSDAYQLIAQANPDPIPDWLAKVGSTGILTAVIYWMMQKMDAKVDKLAEAITELRISIAKEDRDEH